VKVHFLDSCSCVGELLHGAPLGPEDWAVCCRCCALYRCVQTFSVSGDGGPLQVRLFWLEVAPAQLDVHLSRMHVADKLVLLEGLNHFRVARAQRGPVRGQA